MNLGIRRFEGASLVVAMSRIAGLSAAQRENLREIAKVHTVKEKRGQGDALWLMCKVCKEADLAEKVLVLKVEPFDDAPMDAGQLEAFYEKLGFVVLQRKDDDATPHVMMARKPRRGLSGWSTEEGVCR
jgi:predicted GNAT family N-acyltransferase